MRESSHIELVKLRVEREPAVEPEPPDETTDGVEAPPVHRAAETIEPEPVPSPADLDRGAPRANPVEHQQVFNAELVAQVRRLDCRSYDRCLTVAVVCRWPGWSCNSCGVYERAVKDETEALTLAEMGRALGLSRERVRQVEALALRKVRGRLVRRGAGP